MANISYGELINLTALHRIIRSAEEVYWMIEQEGFGTRHIISDGHAIVRLAFRDDDNTYINLKKRFNGHVPGERQALLSTKYKNGCKVTFTERYDQILAILNQDAEFVLIDTLMDYVYLARKKLHIYVYLARDDMGYIQIAEQYHGLINSPYTAYAVQASRVSPIVFGDSIGEERVLIYPVNAPKPQYLADISRGRE